MEDVLTIAIQTNEAESVDVKEAVTDETAEQKFGECDCSNGVCGLNWKPSRSAA